MERKKIYRPEKLGQNCINVHLVIRHFLLTEVQEDLTRQPLLFNSFLLGFLNRYPLWDQAKNISHMFTDMQKY